MNRENPFSKATRVRISLQIERRKTPVFVEGLRRLLHPSSKIVL
jgi:hypothetical protein